MVRGFENQTPITAAGLLPLRMNARAKRNGGVKGYGRRYRYEHTDGHSRGNIAGFPLEVPNTDEQKPESFLQGGRVQAFCFLVHQALAFFF